jgi:hypothetical protein
MLEKGVVWVPKDSFDTYLKGRVADDTRLFMEKIAKICFERQASAVVLFVNENNGNYNCTCFMPIYENTETFEQCGCVFEDIEKCIYLSVFFVENVKELEDRELFFTIKDMAIRAGYWREEYATLVFR